MELLVLVADAGWYDPNPTPKFHEIPRIFTVVHNYGSHFVAQNRDFFCSGSDFSESAWLRWRAKVVFLHFFLGFDPATLTRPRTP